MDGSCELAPRGEVRAFLVPDASGGGDLWITAQGETATPCWDVEIEESPIDVWPPQFAVSACRTSDICVKVVTPYSAVGRFRMGAKVDKVQVADDEGSRDIPVEVEPDLTTAAGSSDGSVVGYSRAPISVEEAISRAAAQLPRSHPNVGVAMTVDEIWYTDGGIVGPVLYLRGRSRTS